MIASRYFAMKPIEGKEQRFVLQLLGPHHQRLARDLAGVADDQVEPVRFERAGELAVALDDEVDLHPRVQVAEGALGTVGGWPPLIASSGSTAR